MSTTDPDDATLAITCELIARQSVTPDDAGCQDAMVSRLKQAGFSVDTMRFGEVDNFWATHGTSGPLLVFAGHTDVVPAGNLKDWNTNPFKPTIKNGVLYGRGASDMKTAIAAFVYASLKFLSSCNNKFNGSLSFLLTADEEGEADFGTKSMVKHLKNGGNVAVMLDQAASDGEFFDFLGIPAKTATSIAKIALKLNALVVPAYAIRSKQNQSINVYFEKEIQHTTYQDMTASLTKSIEARVLSHPEQWYWVHKRWKY